MSNRLEGMVVLRFMNSRVINASVRVEPIKDTQGQTLIYNSDKDGNFSVNIDELMPGHYSITAYHPDAAPPYDQSIEITVDQDKNVTIGDKKIEETLKLEIEPIDNISNVAGVVFLIFILMVLSGVAALYWYLHNVYPSRPKPINEQITRLLNLSKEKASLQDPDYELIAETANDAKKCLKPCAKQEYWMRI